MSNPIAKTKPRKHASLDTSYVHLLLGDSNTVAIDPIKQERYLEKASNNCFMHN